MGALHDFPTSCFPNCPSKKSKKVSEAEQCVLYADSQHPNRWVPAILASMLAATLNILHFLEKMPHSSSLTIEQ